MKLIIDSSLKTAEKFGTRWGLTDIEAVADTRRAAVYKALAPEGSVALKLYKELGASGEGAAITFLKKLKPGFGVRVERINVTRTAVLMSWLEGTALDDMVKQGDPLTAAQHLAAVARAVQETDFGVQFIYERVETKLLRAFSQYAKNGNDSAQDDLFQKAAGMLDHLIATTQQEHVVHGDLTFANVILTTDGPKLIDPKGLRADPAFEFCKAALPSHIDTQMGDYLDQITTRATVMAAAANMPPERLIGWAAVAKTRSTFKHGPDTPQYKSLRPYLAALLDLAAQELKPS